MNKVIFDLCSGSGAWSKPYKDAGYDIYEIDVAKIGVDVREVLYLKELKVHGILAAPPCNHFALSGARWWKEKGKKPLIEALSVVDACLRIVYAYKPEWWALENPVGRLVHYIGPPKMYFHPCDYGDPWTKKTCLWGEFTEPIKDPVEPTQGSWMHTNVRDPAKRAVTPPGFAETFFEANP